MFEYLFKASKKQIAYVLCILFTIGLIINFLALRFFNGSMFLIGLVIASLILSKRFCYTLGAIIWVGACLFDYQHGFEVKALIVKEILFGVFICFSVYTGSELKRYIKRLTHQQEDLSKFNRDMILAFINTIEAKDPYLCGHSINVALYTYQIVKQMGLTHELGRKICLAGIFHDIGKIGVSEGILNKQERLTKEEWHSIQRHPEIGTEIISKIPFLQQIGDMIKYHHLHFDGNGYPRGPVGEEIPLGARIIAVADAFDAMTTDRAYRKALTVEAAIVEIKRCSGTQFDPRVTDAFLATDLISFANGNEDNRQILNDLLIKAMK